MSKTTALNRLVFVLAPLVGALSAYGQTPPPALQTAAYTPLILAVSVNGLPGDDGALLLKGPDDRLWIPASLLTDWGLRPVAPAFTSVNGTPYVGLATLAGLSFNWDQANASLVISARPEAFLATRVNAGEEPTDKVAAYTPGGYLNYDLSVTHSPAANERQAVVDMGLFQGQGLLTSSFTAGTTGGARLMTTYQMDRIKAMKTLRVGDSTNSTGAWGRSVLFGGLQYGTNFAIRPLFIPMALPSVSGKALLPSTVDVYVNHALRTRQQVNAGPFSIQNLPVFTGAGEVQLVVKDLLGREQLITQSFFASPVLLREGLVEEAFEMGWQRNNYGQASNDYSDPFATLTYRKGLSPSFTGEARLEVQKNSATVGLSGAAPLPAWGSVVEASVGLSHADHLSPGALLAASYSYSGKHWSGNAQWQWQNPNFRQLGSNPDRLAQQSGTVQLNLPLGPGTLSVNYLRDQAYAQALTRIINLNYSQRLGHGLFAAFTLFKPLSPDASTTLGLTMTLLLDAQHSASATAHGGAGSHSLYATVSRNTPRDEGFGYRLASLNGGDAARQEATFTRNQSIGSFQAEIVRQQADVSARLGMQGGLALLDGDLYVSRRLDQSFAIVHVEGEPKIPIYLENQVVAHTNSRGRAVVSPLRAYQANNISLDPLTLRMDTSVNSVNQVVVPRSQGGVQVDFETHQVRSVTLTVLLPDGTALPPWTPVEVMGVAKVFVTGLRGEVFVELPQRSGNRVRAGLPEGLGCEFTADVPATAANLSFLEPMTCRPVH